jgi:hypothetical protein
VLLVNRREHLLALLHENPICFQGFLGVRQWAFLDELQSFQQAHAQEICVFLQDFDRCCYLHNWLLVLLPYVISIAKWVKTVNRFYSRFWAL